MSDKKSILIIASSEEAQTGISSMAVQAGITDIYTCDGRSARETAQTRDYTVIAAVLPIGEEYGLDAVSHISRHCRSSLVVFAPAKAYDEVCSRIIHTGAVILPRSIAVNVAVNILKTACIHKERMEELASSNSTLKGAVDEIKLVNRAKCVLMEYLRISEKDAHKQLQKKAMDRRISLSEAAADILKTYQY